MKNRHIVALATIVTALVLSGAGCRTSKQKNDAVQTPPLELTYLTSTLDNKPWNAGIAKNGALFYTKGLKILKIEQPYLQLALPSNNPSDTRALLISIKGFETKTGKYSGEMEVLLSGSPTGDMKDNEMQGYQDDVPTQKTNFTFTVTDWKTISPNQAILSATFEGDLKGLAGADNVTFKDGRITDLPVTVYTVDY